MMRQFLLFLIIILGIFLRLYKFHELFYFAIDEEKGAYIIQQIATLSHFPSVGHPTSIGFRLGPIFYYFAAPFYRLIFPSPETIGYLSVTSSIFSMILLYQLTKKINKTTGLIAVFFYAVSFLNVIYERRGWQLSFESLLILILIHSLLKLKKNKEKYIFPLTIVIIIMTQLEIGLFNFIPLVLVFFVINKITVRLKYLLISLGLIVLANSGLFIFDIRHQFLNTRYLLNYFRKDASIRIAPNIPLTGIRSSFLAVNLIPHTLARLFIPTGSYDLAIQYANCPQYLAYKQSQTNLLVLVILSIIFLYSLLRFKRYRNRKDENYLILTISLLFLAIHFGAIFIYTYIFQGEMAEYYLQPTFLIMFILAANFLTDLIKHRLSVLVFVFCIICAYVNIKYLTGNYHSYGLKNKLEAVNYSLSIVKNNPFTLESFQTCWYSGGYRYLYTLAGNEPIRSYMDQYLSEYYTPDTDTSPKYTVIILTPELIGVNPAGFEEYREKTKKEAEFARLFGAIEVYIKSN